MNPKRTGTRNEHRCRRLLETAGYAVTRAAGSLGAWDLVGIGPADVVVVQVKSNRPPAPAERETPAGFSCPSNCKRLVHVRHDRQRWPLVTEL